MRLETNVIHQKPLCMQLAVRREYTKEPGSLINHFFPLLLYPIGIQLLPSGDDLQLLTTAEDCKAQVRGE